MCIPAACVFFDLMSFCPQQNCQIRVRPNGVFSGNSDGECCFAADQGNVLLFDGRCVLSANNRYGQIQQKADITSTHIISFKTFKLRLFKITVGGVEEENNSAQLCML